MDCARLLLTLEVGHPNAALLEAAGDLATRFGAAITGVAVCQPLQILYNDAFGWTDLAEQDRREIQRGTDAAEAEFRAALGGRNIALDWRSAVTFTPISEFIAEQARGADLVIARSSAQGTPENPTRRVDVGTLVMQAGRPVMLIPETLRRLALDHVLVAWKDTREARRAIADALPLMRLATTVTVLEIADHCGIDLANQRVAEVASWCGLHGVTARGTASLAGGSDADRLNGIARDLSADLIVAGAYAHSRLREWAFGGVTHDLLTNSSRCVLLSH
jgi:nucleotide-binding universal stress UspA family protein